MQGHQVINKYRDICFSEGTAVEPTHLTGFSQCCGYIDIQNVRVPPFFFFFFFYYRWFVKTRPGEYNSKTVVNGEIGALLI